MGDGVCKPKKTDERKNPSREPDANDPDLGQSDEIDQSEARIFMNRGLA
jgi:hypothetical protein